MSLKTGRTHPGFYNKFMNLHELREWVKRRLSRKARQAEGAYVSEFTIKSTTNCLNHGIQLSENIWHCKINALGLHEQGASQCWNNKARVCPLFELSRDVETLKRDFRKIRPNELAIRWPSLGELIRFDHMLSLVDEPEDSNYEETTQSAMHSSGNDQLSSGETEGVGPTDEDVRGEYGSRCSDLPPTNQEGIDPSGQSDSGSSKFDSGNSERLSLAALGGPGDRSGADRAAV
jgi:hypothetical protein